MTLDLLFLIRRRDQNLISMRLKHRILRLKLNLLSTAIVPRETVWLWCTEGLTVDSLKSWEYDGLTHVRSQELYFDAVVCVVPSFQEGPNVHGDQDVTSLKQITCVLRKNFTVLDLVRSLSFNQIVEILYRLLFNVNTSLIVALGDALNAE